MKATVPPKIATYLNLKPGDQLRWHIPNEILKKKLKTIGQSEPVPNLGVSQLLSTSIYTHPLVQDFVHRLDEADAPNIKATEEWFQNQIRAFSTSEQITLLSWINAYLVGKQVVLRQYTITAKRYADTMKQVAQTLSHNVVVRKIKKKGVKKA